MKKIMVIIASMCMLFSCVKKEQKKSEESRIVDMLNENKSDEALDHIDAELAKNPTDELYYLKASALSIKAGVDIYALFPLLKLKVFDVAISQWSQNREFQKKSDSQKMNIGFDTEALSKEKEAGKTKSKYDASKLNYTATIAYSNYSEHWCNVTIRTNLVNRSDYPNYTNLNFGEGSSTECESLKNRKSETPLLNSDSFFKVADEKIRKDWVERLEWENKARQGKIKKKNDYVKALGAFWTLIDLIPLAKKIPKLDPKGFATLEEAQDILTQLRERRKELGKKDELSQKARKQLIMISSLKIVARLQNSFDIDQITDPSGFLCKSNDKAAEELITGSKDALFLLNSIEDQEILSKNPEFFKNLKDKYEGIVTTQFEDPIGREIAIKNLDGILQKYKLENCEDAKEEELGNDNTDEENKNEVVIEENGDKEASN